MHLVGDLFELNGQLLNLLGIELRYLSRLAHNSVTVPSELFRFRETADRKEEPWHVEAETMFTFVS